MASFCYTKGEICLSLWQNVDGLNLRRLKILTLGEAQLPGFEQIPFLSKEVWLDDSRPGRVSIIFVWESLEAWMRVGSAEIQRRLQAEFDSRFKHPVKLVEAWHEDTNFGLHRWSRFER